MAILMHLKVFKQIKLTSNDNVIALGDYIGYYYDANECLNLLRKKNNLYFRKS